MSKRTAGETGNQEKAKRQRQPTEIAIKFLLPDVVVGALLSKKAAALKRIRDQTGGFNNFNLKLSAKGQFYPGTRDERMVSLSGPPQLVHRACCLLQDQIIDDPYLVTDESGTNSIGPRQGQMKIIVSDRAASKIIGSRGSVVKDISRHFNIVVAITQSKENVVPNERLVTIIGPSRNVFDSLEPITYQIAQQDAHVDTEFEYYEQYYNIKPGEEELKEDNVEEGKSEVEGNKEGEKKEEDIVEIGEPSVVEEEKTPETSKCEPPSPEKEVIGIVEEKTEGKSETDTPELLEKLETPEKTEEPEKTQVPEKTEKAPEKSEKKKVVKKDGRWVWQQDQQGKPAWVWVDNKQPPPHQRKNNRDRARGW